MHISKQLLEKYLTGQCSHEEKQQLYHYLLQNEVEEYDEILKSLWADLSTAPKPNEDTSRRMYQAISKEIQYAPRRLSPWHYRVAASVAILMLISLGYYLFITEDEVYQTCYGEVNKLVLPDSSIVYLNANSRLTYSSSLATDEIREVWLDGEAYFEVTHQQTAIDNASVKLIVHTEQVDVEVVGTSFNVKERRGITQVALDEGKVQLRKPDNQDDLVALEPGESAIIEAGREYKVQRLETSSQLSSWKNNELYFNDQSLGEIQQILEDNYGVTIQFSDPKLSRLRFTGSTPADNLPLLFVTLEKSFALKIKKSDEGYIIRNLP